MTHPELASHFHHGDGRRIDFKKRTALALANERLGVIMDRGTRRQDGGRRTILPELPDPLATRELAARIKDHTLQNLDHYLRQLVGNVQANGGRVHFAETGEQANAIIAGIARDAGVRMIIKSKSMVSEEIELNHGLEAAGFEVVETDLGEYILQLGHEKPSHIVAPVIHKNRQDIAALFQQKLGIPYTEDPEVLTAAARKVLREKFRAADMGITGVNFAVAETGSLCIVTNEGNGRFCGSRPRVVVSLMGIEKLVPRMRDLAVFLKLLGKSATGQRITCYTSLMTGPKREGDFDGPQEHHLLILDRGRTSILASDYRSTLRCIRCGACLNACPVYRKIGGHAYDSVYPGPIGKLVTPLLNSLEQYENLPQASSLCGACLDACPVRIDIPSMLIHMRNDLVKRGRGTPGFGLGFRAWRMGMSSPTLYRWGARLTHWFMDAGARDGWHHRLPGMLSAWTDHRDFPAMADRPFRDRWDELQAELKTRRRQGDGPQASAAPAAHAAAHAPTPTTAPAGSARPNGADPGPEILDAPGRQFLERVTKALANRGQPVSLPDDLEVSRVIHPDDLIATFCTRVEQSKMQAYRVPDEAAMIEQVREILRELGASNVLVTQEDIPGRLDLLTRLKSDGLTMHCPNEPDAAFEADVGITAAAGAIAETGSVVLESGGPRRRLASLAVPHHIAIVRAEQIVPDLLDWAARQPADMPANQVLVSGPSKTADIELTLVMGVHGPRTEHIIVVG